MEYTCQRYMEPEMPRGISNDSLILIDLILMEFELNEKSIKAFVVRVVIKHVTE